MSAQAELSDVVQEWEAWLGPEDLAKARYHLRMQIGRFVAGLVTPLLWAALWLPTGWAVALRDALQANASWWRTWLYIILVGLSAFGLALPFLWWFEFRVEQRLGTLRQSFRAWLWDVVKEKAVAGLVQSAFVAGLYWVFRRWPDAWMIGLSVGVGVFLVVVYALQPVLLRLRYRAEPLDDPDLHARLAELFARAGVPFSGVAVLQVSEKTARGNAALVPHGAGTRVVVFDTLLQALSPRALVAVVAHELGHKVHRDILKLMLALAVGLVAVLSGGYGLLRVVGWWDGLQGPGDVATLPLLGLILSWLGAGLQVLLNAYMRRVEASADAYAFTLTRDAAGLEEAFRVLARQNKSLPQPPLWVERLLYNHPSLVRRVLALRRMAAREPQFRP